MERTRGIIIAVLLFGAMQVVSAQSLSADEKQELQFRAKQKIEVFQGHLSTIASRNISNANKNAARKEALDLFIGKGEPYMYEDDYGNRRQHEAVKMQVSSKRTGRIYTRLMKNYLTSLANRPKMVIDSSVEVISVEVIYIDVRSIRETSEGKNEAVAYFWQFYCDNDGKKIYRDVTEKKIKIYVEKETIPMPDENQQVIWPVLLGDVSICDGN